MSDSQWTYSAYPSWFGAIGAGVSALIGLGIALGVMWILIWAGADRFLVVGYLLYVYLMESALATYRKWQRKA